MTAQDKRNSQSCSSKDHQRSCPHGDLSRLELADAPEGLAIQRELQHVQHLVIKRATKGDGMRALLVAAPK